MSLYLQPSFEGCGLFNSLTCRPIHTGLWSSPISSTPCAFHRAHRPSRYARPASWIGRAPGRSDVVGEIIFLEAIHGGTTEHEPLITAPIRGL